MVPTFMVPWGCPKRIGNNSGKIDIYRTSQYICIAGIASFASKYSNRPDVINAYLDSSCRIVYVSYNVLKSHLI